MICLGFWDSGLCILLLFNLSHLRNLSWGQGREVTWVSVCNAHIGLPDSWALRDLLMASGSSSGSWVCCSDVSHPAPKGLEREGDRTVWYSILFEIGGGSSCSWFNINPLPLAHSPSEMRKGAYPPWEWTTVCDSAFFLHLGVTCPFWLGQWCQEVEKMFWAVLLKKNKTRIGPTLPR